MSAEHQGAAVAPLAAPALAGQAPPASVREYEASVLRRKRAVLVAQIVFGVGALLFWEYASGRIADPFFVSSPTRLFAKLSRWFSSGSIYPHLAATMQAMLSGFAIGAGCGFTVGVIFGRFRFVADVLEPYITALYSLPMIALTPLFIMWFGIGIASKIAVASVAVFFVVFSNTFSGIREVNPLYIHATQIMGASRWQVTRTVMLPSATAWMIAGLKVSVPYALVGAVVGEFMSANRGVGFLIAQATGLFDTDSVFAGLIILGVIASIVSAIVRRFERHALRWKP